MPNILKYLYLIQKTPKLLLCTKIPLSKPILPFVYSSRLGLALRKISMICFKQR